jgi:hypothetical protein
LDGIGGEMVSVFALSVVDRRFEPTTGQIKDNTTGICCFSVKQAELSSKSNNWLAQFLECVLFFKTLNIKVM